MSLTIQTADAMGISSVAHALSLLREQDAQPQSNALILIKELESLLNSVWSTKKPEELHGYLSMIAALSIRAMTDLGCTETVVRASAARHSAAQGGGR